MRTDLTQHEKWEIYQDWGYRSRGKPMSGLEQMRAARKERERSSVEPLCAAIAEQQMEISMLRAQWTRFNRVMASTMKPKIVENISAKIASHIWRTISEACKGIRSPFEKVMLVFDVCDLTFADRVTVQRRVLDAWIEHMEMQLEMKSPTFLGAEASATRTVTEVRLEVPALGYREQFVDAER